MNLNLKPIQTKYAGYLFRSRLEAKWAVFFDLVGLKWQYEPEGFVLPNGVQYLPDFLVMTPQNNECWYEIKPEGTTFDEKSSMFFKSFDDEVRHSLIVGDPVYCFSNAGKILCPRCGFIQTASYVYDDAIYCYYCDGETPSGGGHEFIKGIFVNYQPHKGSLIVSENEWDLHSKIVDYFALRARSSRFEFGQSGATA